MTEDIQEEAGTHMEGTAKVEVVTVSIQEEVGTRMEDTVMVAVDTMLVAEVVTMGTATVEAGTMEVALGEIMVQVITEVLVAGITVGVAVVDIQAELEVTQDILVGGLATRTTTKDISSHWFASGLTLQARIVPWRAT